MSFDQVQEFATTFDVVTRTSPSVRNREAKLRFELIREELFDELNKAFKEVDIVELADALGDIRYVVIGAAQVFGISDEVQSRVANDTRNYEAQLLNPKSQEETLQLLRLSILRNDPEAAAMTLALLLKLVEDASKYFRIDLDPIVEAIHKSNMTKLDDDGNVIRRESDNKVLKCPKNYKSPTEDIENLLFGALDADAS